MRLSICRGLKVNFYGQFTIQRGPTLLILTFATNSKTETSISKKRHVFTFAFFSRLVEMVMSLENPLLMTFEPRNYSNWFKKSNFVFVSQCVILNVENQKLSKRRVPNNPWDPSGQFLKVLYMAAISIQNTKCKK